MTNWSRITIIGLAGFLVLLFAVTSRAQTRPAIFEKMVKDLWSRFVGQDRGDPLYMESAVRRNQHLPFMGMGA